MCATNAIFLDVWSLEGEKTCEEAEWHSNCSVLSDRYFHPPTVERAEEKKDKEQIHHYYLSCVWTQKWGCLSASRCSVPAFTLHLRYRGLCCTCYRQDLLYRLLCYSIISELFITPAPYWWTGVAPYQQRIRYSYRSAPLIPVYSCGFLDTRLMYHTGRLTPHHCLALFCIFHHSSEIYTSNLYFPPDLTPTHMLHLLIDTLSSWHDTDLCPHVPWASAASSWLGMAFIYVQCCFPVTDIVRGKCSIAHAVLTLPTLSFGSGALTNIPHQFLMHSHMVVLFFFRYSAR